MVRPNKERIPVGAGGLGFSVMRNPAVDLLAKKVMHYKRLLEYLDRCGEFTFDKWVEANRIAESKLSQAELQEAWRQTLNIAPPLSRDDDRPTDAWGPEYARWKLRQTATKAITAFAELVAAAGTEKPTPAKVRVVPGQLKERLGNALPKVYPPQEPVETRCKQGHVFKVKASEAGTKVSCPKCTGKYLIAPAKCCACKEVRDKVQKIDLTVVNKADSSETVGEIVTFLCRDCAIDGILHWRRKVVITFSSILAGLLVLMAICLLLVGKEFPFNVWLVFWPASVLLAIVVGAKAYLELCVPTKRIKWREGGDHSWDGVGDALGRACIPHVLEAIASADRALLKITRRMTDKEIAKVVGELGRIEDIQD